MIHRFKIISPLSANAMKSHPNNLLKLVIAVSGLLLGVTGVSVAQEQTYPLSDSMPPLEAEPQQQPVPDFSNTQVLTTCTMKYKLSGFSFGYKQYDGTGEVRCRNGQKAQVALSSKSIGFTIGKSEIEGDGVFSEVKNINEIFGDYVSMESHIGFLNSLDAQLLTRGEISLALKGKGRGIDIGATIGDLSIKPR